METAITLGVIISLGVLCLILLVNTAANKNKHEQRLEIEKSKSFKEGANYIINTLDFNMDGITDSADVKKMFGIYNRLRREVDRAGGAIKNVQ